MLSETKLDDTFPTSQFLMQGYSTHFRKDRTSKGGGILLYIREDVLLKSMIIMKVSSLKLT